MIQFQHVLKQYRVHGRRHVVLNHVCALFPSGSRIGILGANGAGKSTLLRLIAGSEEPDAGQINKSGRVSFPIGFTGTFNPLYSARENVRFLSYIYEMDTSEVIGWIDDFAELGDYFEMPVGTYSSGMFARLAFATSFAFDFDVYLVDEAIEVGDERFRQKCWEAFRQRIDAASLILVSHNPHTVRQYCDSGAILHGGNLVVFNSIDEAIEGYRELLRLDHV